MSTSRRRQVGALVAVLVGGLATVLVSNWPALYFLRPPLVWLSTLVHELGHGLTALLCGGSFHELVLLSDGSGFAQISVSAGLPSALASAGGLVGPAIAGAIGFRLLSNERACQIACIVSAGALVVIAALWVRTLFGWAYIGGLAGCCWGVWKLGGAAPRVWTAFISVQLAVSVFTRGDYLFTAVARTERGDFPSDVAAISEQLFGPFWLWGALCGLFSVGVLLFGVRSLLRTEV